MMILLRRRQGTPRPRQVRTTFAIRFYRIYDTGKEIDISRLEEALSSGHTIARSTFTRVKPKSIAMDMPPLLLRLPQEQWWHIHGYRFWFFPGEG